MKRAPKRPPPRPPSVPRTPTRRQRRGRAVAAEVVATAIAVREQPAELAALDDEHPLDHARRQMMARWMRNRSPDTERSYKSALRHFALWARADGRLRLAPHGPDIDAALALCDLGGARANVIAQDWIDAQKGMSKAGIASRFAAIKSLCIALVAAERSQYVPIAKVPRRQRKNALDVEAAYKGIPQAFAKILIGLRAKVAGEHDVYDARDYALLRMGSGMGLRRIELVRLDVGDLDFSTGLAQVHGKGREARESMRMPEGLLSDLRRWLRERKVVAGITGPLFVSLGKRNHGGRLTRNTLNAILSARARQFKVKLRPHDMRRILCTSAIDELGIYEALKITRHADVRTLGLYDLGAAADVASMADRVERRVRGRAEAQKQPRATARRGKRRR